MPRAALTRSHRYAEDRLAAYSELDEAAKEAVIEFLFEGRTEKRDAYMAARAAIKARYPKPLQGDE